MINCYYCHGSNIKTLDSFVKVGPEDRPKELQGYYCHDCGKYFLGEVTKKTRQTFL